jgi:hypothetical protein
MRDYTCIHNHKPGHYCGPCDEERPGDGRRNQDGDARLAEIRAEAQRETYGGKLDFGHVSLGDFMEWVRLMQPRYARIEGYENLTDFDVNSILGLFEDWTQGKQDGELNRLVSR